MTILDSRGDTPLVSTGGESASAVPPGKLAFHRLPLLALGMISLLCATWAGLVRLGFAWPVANASWVSLHGPLMVCGIYVCRW